MRKKADKFGLRQTYAQAANTAIILVGGVRPSQVFWQVAGTFTVGDASGGATFNGIALSATQVTITTGSYFSGRILGQTGVALQQTYVQQPQDTASSCNTAPTASTSCSAALTSTITATSTFTQPASVTTFTQTLPQPTASTITLGGSTSLITFFVTATTTLPQATVTQVSVVETISTLTSISTAPGATQTLTITEPTQMVMLTTITLPGSTVVSTQTLEVTRPVTTQTVISGSTSQFSSSLST